VFSGKYFSRTNLLPLAATTWVWDGVQWTVYGPLAPHGRKSPAMAYDAARQRVVLFGGDPLFFRESPFGDTWQWDGSAWSRAAPAQSPRARGGAALAYDAARGRVVLFGGTVSDTERGDDTWEWDGVAWTQQQPPAKPSARAGHALAYDAARARVILFGGFDRTIFRDTWEWDGQTWTERQPLTVPPPYGGHGLAYDAGRQRTVLQGTAGDTWEWDGANWSLRSSTGGPGPRTWFALAFDSARGRTVLHGGRSDTGVLLADTWEWDGQTWQGLPAGSPSRDTHAMAYDAARQQLVLFGGAASGGRPAGVWLRTTAAAATQTTGAGCAGSSPPVLVGFGRPAVGNRAFALDVVGAAANLPVAAALALGALQLPLPGNCTLWIDPGLTLGALAGATGGAGFATLPLPVPLARSLVGVSLESQAIVLDPSGPFFGAWLTNGVHMRVGD
jgi:hypothetical protein